MSGFIGSAKLDPVPGATDATGRPVYRLREDLYFCLGSSQDDCLAVPAGRVTNLATFPRGWSPVGVLFWWLLRRFVFRDIASIDGRWVSSTVLHDSLCSEDYPGYNNPVSGFNRYESDAIFRMALESEIPVPESRFGQVARRVYILLAYWAVRSAAIWGGKA